MPYTVSLNDVQYRFWHSVVYNESEYYLRGGCTMITVNVCGYDSMHKMVFDRSYPNGYDDYVMLLIKTKSFFEQDGVTVDMPPNTVMIYSIHSYIHYGCREPHYNDDWIHFHLTGTDSDILDRLAIPLNHPFTLPYIGTLTEYSKLIVHEKLSSNPHKQEVLDALMHALFYSVANQLYAERDDNTNNRYYYPLNALRMEIMNSPYKKWDTPELAQRLHLSISHFQHLYKNFFGVTCIQDVINARVKQAQLYLCISDMSISSLALFCGYESELHFMRQFKKLTGMTPSQYRAAYSQQDDKMVSS